MSFDWSQYLDVARSLVGQGSKPIQEAAYRCAVSRAYYAAFCHARNYARDRHGFRPTRKDAHRRVRKHFHNRGMSHIADKLLDLSRWRNDCDYEDVVPKTSLMPVSAINEAQKIFNKLK